MPTSASPPTRKEFDYAILDVQTSQFWQFAIQAITRIVLAKYLPQDKSLGQLDEFLESAILFNPRLEDFVFSCFLPDPEILSIINRLDHRGLLVEPGSRQLPNNP